MINEQHLSQIFSALLDGFNQKAIDENPAFFEYLTNIDTIHMDNLSLIEGTLIYPLEQLIEEALENKYGDDIASNVCYIILHWSFYESHLEKLIDKFEGFGCVIDKSRSLLRKYLKSKLEGIEPNFSEDREQYWEPKFGSIEQWMSYIETLMSLRYGKVERYLTAYMALHEAGKKKKG
jgi:hypothetical protein